MGRIPPNAWQEVVDALRDLGYNRFAPYLVQKPTVLDGGYVLRKPDHGVIIIQEEKPRQGCAYDEYEDSTLENEDFVIYCTARIGVQMFRSCRGLINDYDFVFKAVDEPKAIGVIS